MRWLWCLLLFCCLNTTGCRDRRNVTPAFYFWKTRYTLSDADSTTLRGTLAQKVYLRFSDVDWSGAERKILPRAIAEFGEPPDTALAYVPVIFITARTLAHIPDSASAENLAHNISTLIEGLCSGVRIRPREIQIDCDWTARSQATYFALLRALKRQSFFEGKALSVTIRLHQLKYHAKNGIPPADRGMLMCYNMGNTRRPGPHNSILDAEEAEEYLADVEDYPIPLDVALPLFRWCLLFRDEKLVGILRDVPPEEAAQASFLHLEKETLYRCMADTLWHGYALHTGDVLRAEIPSAGGIRRIARYTARRTRSRDLTVALYHLDSLTCSKYSTDELESFFSPFR